MTTCFLIEFKFVDHVYTYAYTLNTSWKPTVVI